MQLYRHVPVWIRTPKGCALYQCVELLGRGFMVQSKDYFYEGDVAQGIAHSQRQFVELLIESAPEDRTTVYPTLEEAIAQFEREWS